MIHDFYDDSTGAVLREILTEGEVPDFVRKSASLVPSEEIRADKQVFAWKAAKKFPLDTPEDTWLSAKYLAKTSHLIPMLFRQAIAGEIEKAAVIHDLDLAEPAQKQASTVEYLVDAVLPMTDMAVKRASEVDYQGDGMGRLRAYGITDKESVKTAALWFPRGLEGGLAGQRQKVATRLLALCEEHGVEPGGAIIEETRPIKRSSLKEEIGRRISTIMEVNAMAARHATLEKTAAYGGANVSEVKAIDTRLIKGYEHMFKEASKDALPKKFWDELEQLDKVAGFDAFEGLTPAAAMRHREIEDDVVPSFAKLAGTIVSVEEVMTKVSAEMWADLGRMDEAAFEIAGAPYNQAKVAGLLPKMAEETQQIVLHRVRGW